MTRRMSCSRRHTPIVGITTAKSDKRDKVRAHRRERRAVKVQLQQQRTDEALPPRQAFGHAWDFAKDGKQHIDPDACPTLMRK
jgi:hypothetical protein